MFRHSTIRLRFSPSLLLRSFSRSLWRGLLRRRATPVWGQARFRQHHGQPLSNTVGDFNSASGAYALFNNTTGELQYANGLQALFSNTTGIDNTASGLQALQNNTTGSNNTASGVDALRSNTTGGFNTAIGADALFSITGGKQHRQRSQCAFLQHTGT